MSAGCPFSRRDMLKAGGAASILAAGGALMPTSSIAASDMKGVQVPGFYRFKLGDFEITVLSDGSYTLPTNLLGTNVPREDVRAFLEANFLSPDERLSHVNIPLINTGKELVLVDVGGGMNWMATAGKLSCGWTRDRAQSSSAARAPCGRSWRCATCSRSIAVRRSVAGPRRDSPTRPEPMAARTNSRAAQNTAGEVRIRGTSSSVLAQWQGQEPGKPI